MGQIVDHCLCKQHIVCQPDPGMVIFLLMTLFPLLTSSYRIQTLRNSANFVPSGLMRVGGEAFSLDATDGGNFANLGCKGTYDKTNFSVLNSVCDRCYDLFRDHDIHSLCRSQCFSSSYFTSCVSSLMLGGNMSKYQNIKQHL